MTASVKIRRTTSYTMDIDGVEFPINFEAETNYGKDPLLKVSSDGLKAVLCYLTHDEHCDHHPLDDDDYAGRIIGRGKYETRNHSEQDMFEALGLDRYGDINYSLVDDEVEARWEKVVEDLPAETWDALFKGFGLKFDDDQEHREAVNALRDELLSTSIVAEGDWVYAIYRAERYITLFDLSMDMIRGGVMEADLDFDLEKVQKEEYETAMRAGKIGNRFAILLDVYDHSGLHWSMSGNGTQCRWDTSRGAGVWLPSEDLEKEIISRAEHEAYAYVRETPVHLRGTEVKYQLVQVTGWDDNSTKQPTLESVAMSDDWTALWNMAKDLAAQLAQAEPLTDKRRRWAENEVAERMCQGNLDDYNAWLMGDNWCCVTEHLSRESVDDEWESDDYDICCGYTGSEHAMYVLEHEYFNPEAKKLA